MMFDFLEKHRTKFSVAIFMAMLSLPLLGHAFLQSDTPVSVENRVLVTFPGTDRLAADWPGYTTELNTWMEDRVGFRSDLIALHGTLREELDLERSQKAVIGDESWYFNALNGALKMHQGLLPYGAGEAEAWLEAAREMQAAVEASGGKFVVLLAPNKHSIYGEKLSEYSVRVPGPRRAQTLEALAPDFGVDVIYPDAELLAAKTRDQVYYKTDTHWSKSGAFIGYQALMSVVNEVGLSVERIDRDTQTVLSETSKAGDIYGLLAIADGKAETISELRLRAPQTFEQVGIPEYDWSGFKALRMKVAGSTGPSVLVYGDSFSGGLLPYLRESFSEVTFVHHRWEKVPMSALDTGDYDLVVLEMVERSLSGKLEPDFPPR